MVVYKGSLENSTELVRFFRRESAKLRMLRRLVISPEKTEVRDVNGDGMEFPGLTYGSAALETLLSEAGVVFNARTLHNPNATADGVKEFRLSARHPWGQDRVM